MVQTRFALILFLCMVAHKAACHAPTLSKAFLKSLDMVQICYCWRYFSHRILRLKICSVVLLPTLNPACSSAIITLAWGFKSVQDEFQHSFAQMTDEADNNSCLLLELS